MSNIAVTQIPEPQRHATSTALTAGDPVNILLVDDRPANLMVYQAILEELGQNLVIARSGEEALRELLKHEFAVILLDVNMPGMDGFETASLIRKRKKSAGTPIIFLTAFTDEMRVNQGYASGAVDYLPTPIMPEVLKAKVRVFIELFQMRQLAALQAEERVKRTAAEEAVRRSSFLVKVSESLAHSQSQAKLLRLLVPLPIPLLADISMAWLGSDDANTGRMEYADADRISEPGREPPSLTLSDLPWLEKAVRQVVATGQSQLVDKIPPPPPAYVLPPLSSALLLPLAVQGATRGALVLARKYSGKPYQRDDMPLASELAGRAGVALENVMLMERIQEADRRKDEFLGMLAHELRNPLGPIHNAVSLLKRAGTQEPRLSELRDIIEHQVKHMVRLIDDLLDATRIAHGKILLRKERCDLTGIVRQAAADYRTIFDASGMRLEVYVPDMPLWVEGDPTRLTQAIGNLLHNAHKFTSSGGVITVRLEREKDGGMGVVTVSDTGIGIEPAMLPCVFDIFRQAEQGLARSRGGLGLGLALVKGLVEMHGGDVRAASKGLGKGAEFTLRLPLGPVQDAGTSYAPAAPVPSGAKYRILVIEDNRDAAESTQMLLHLDGHEVQIACTGSTGLKTAHTFRPQVILCDIGLPGMDGYQVARCIRQDAALASAYIVALTGYGRDEDQRQAQAAGFDLHLTKPIDYDSLRRALAQADIKYH